MIRAARWLLAIVVGALVLAIVAAVMVGFSLGPMDPAVIDIDGETLRLGPWGWGHLLALGLALFCGFTVILLVVPLAVLLPLALVGLALAAAFLALAGVAAVVLSPLLLLGWIGWRLASPRRRAGPIAP